MEFLENIKKESRPDLAILKDVDETVAKINEQLKKSRIKAECVKGGSVAKGTFLKGDFDVDLFVKFDYSYAKENISDILETQLKVLFPSLDRLHGSRDYFQAKNSLNYEIVPVIDITDPKRALNVTDMSPLHVSWVKKHLKKGGEDEIRLAKLFCKAAGVYGAESFIQGFSGHVIDILIIQYGSLIDLIKNAARWKPKVVIDTEKHYENKEMALFEINESKRYGPLIVVDPVLPERNAASSLSMEKFLLFQKRAKEFLKNPGRSYFERKKFDIPALRKRAGKRAYVVILAKALPGKTDVSGAKLLKAYEYIHEGFKRNDFTVFQSGWEWDRKDDAVFWYILNEKELSPSKIVEGPPEALKEHALSFRQKYKNSFTKDGRLFAEAERKHRTPASFAEEVLKDPYVREKTLSLQIETFK